MSDFIESLTASQRDLEQLFAACVIISPTHALQESGWLIPSVINDTEIRRFWEAVRSRVSLTGDEDQARNLTMQAAIEAGIHVRSLQWMGDVTNTYMVNAYAQEIANRARNVAIGAKMSDLHTALIQNQHEKVKQILDEMHNIPVHGEIKIHTGKDIHAAFVDALHSNDRSIETFIPNLDSNIGGLERQTLLILAARPGMGKTALAWQIARNVAVGNQRVLFFSLEMSEVALWQRAACAEAGTTWRDVRAGKTTKDQNDRLIGESGVLVDAYGDRLMIDDQPQTTDTIWQKISNLKPDLVIVDHIRYLKDKGGRDEREVKRLGYITERLHDMAKAFNFPILALAQLSRRVESQSDKCPTLADLRDSGEIEENADLVLMMHSDDYYKKIKPLVRDTEVWVEKFRNGPQHTCINLRYDLNRQWFDMGTSVEIKQLDDWYHDR